MSRVASTPTAEPRRSSLYLIAERFTPTRRVDSWRRRRAEDKQCKKNRKTIDKYIGLIGKKGGGKLSLDSNGACFFPYKKFVFCIEVPHDKSELCLFSTKVCHLTARSNRKEVMRVALTLNSKTEEKNDSPIEHTPSFETSKRNGRMTHLSVPIMLSPLDRVVNLIIPAVGDAATLNMQVPIKGLTYEQMVECTEGFIKSALDVNRRLDSVAKGKL